MYLNNESWFMNSLRLPEPNIAASVHSIQAYQKQYSDQKRCLQEFVFEQEVIVCNFRGDIWICSKNVDHLEQVLYLAHCHNGDIWRSHVSYIQEMPVT